MPARDLAEPYPLAAPMAHTHSPLVAVIERDSDQVRLLGAITAARLLNHFSGAS